MKFSIIFLYKKLKINYNYKNIYLILIMILYIGCIIVRLILV